MHYKGLNTKYGFESITMSELTEKLFKINMKIVMLCGKGCSSLFMYNGIKDDFKIDAVIQEVKPSIKKLVKRRIKNLGFIEVLNQSFFSNFNSKNINAFF